MPLQEVEKVSITILMDNSTDFLLTNSAHAVRPPLIVNEKFNLPPPVAEHGFSALVNIVVKYIQSKGEKNNSVNDQKTGMNSNTSIINTFLFDTGVSENGVLHNADTFGTDFSQIDGIILSHGHFDHFTGLANILKRISSSRQRPSDRIDVFVHPDALLRRWEIYPDGKRAKMPFLDEKQLEELGAKIHKNTGITLLPNNNSPSLLITGHIPRQTSFEKGFPFQYAEDQQNDDSHNKKSLTPDPLVKDDQAIVVNVRNKGLIILTGCGHAGVVNTINYAKKITGLDKIYAVIGGFHLPADDGIYEEAIDPTLQELQKADPDYIIPCHCTGWKATNKIIDLMPEKFIQSGVGTIFTF
jgi:7,8-dihydropterin-6-yl-methyl-4-(beta-D-ribofuranosyl)aminobenzene 5'-phosphate synthase